MDTASTGESDETRPPETEEEKYLRFSRSCRHFIDYINYDWEKDERWKQF